VRAAGRLGRVAAIVVALSLATACRSSQKPLAAQDVQRVFRSEGLSLRVVVDSATLDQRRIDRLTHLTRNDVGARRAAKLSTRGSLERIRARAASHPMKWLAPSMHPIDLRLDVIVWGRVADAKANEATVKRAAARVAHLLGGSSGTRGSEVAVVRNRNVVVLYPSANARTARLVTAAMKRLDHGS